MHGKWSHATASERITLPSFSEPLAKREKTTDNSQTFNGHIADCLTVLSHLVMREAKVFDFFCARFSLDKKRLLRSLFLSTVLHDIGKLTEEFQTNIRTGKHSGARPHAFFSMPILNWLFSKYFKETFLEPGLFIEICTVLGHHTQLNNNMYQTITKDVHYLNADVAAFLNTINDHYATMEFANEISLEKIEVEPKDVSEKIYSAASSSLESQIKDFIRELMLCVSGYAEKERAKSLYVFSQSVLKTCDHTASKYFDEFAKTQSNCKIFGPVLKDPSHLFQDLTIRKSEVIPPETPLYRYQDDLITKRPAFALVRAPCGRGKTNAAVLWAKACCENYGCNRIIVAMPTQITSNAMRTTLGHFSSKEQVGIFHGRSFYLLKEERKKLAQRLYDDSNDLDAEDLDEVKTENFMGNVYHKPITVSTTDHLVYSLVHGYSQADYALGNIQRAALIFDEVHYYERQSLECLISLFEILRRMKIPHLVMSGTLPSFFVDKINEGKSYMILDDAEGLNLIPYAFRKRLDERLITETSANEKVLDEIVANYKEGLRQFVILNTVTRAKRFYVAVKERLGPAANVVLHHSQLSFNDRLKKEELILRGTKTRPFILVATQVIEISLNISCDVMYTEIAPADALAQRGGRLHRGEAKPRSNLTKHNMYVFGVEKVLPYDQKLIRKTEEALFDGPASHLRLVEVCNQIYDSTRLHDHAVFRSLFSSSTLFGPPYWNISSEDEEGRDGFRFREESQYRMTSVIPESLYKNDEHNLTVENEVQIPLWKLLKYQDDATMFYQATRFRGRKELTFWICRTPYNGEMGFLEGPVPESETFGSNIF